MPLRIRSAVALVLVALAAPFARPAHAQSTKLFINTGPDPFLKYSHLRYDGRDWTGTTAVLKSAFNITTGPVVPGITTLLQYDALWIDQRYGAVPTQAELNALLAYIATGRRVVIIGENASPIDLNFFTWGVPVLQALGGTEGPGDPSNPMFGTGCLYGTAHTILANQLTQGVTGIGIGCAGYAVGGTPLFDYNVATLWGPSLNVLTVLDANVFDDYFWGEGQNSAFRSNVVGFLQASNVVPEPATFALLLPALLGVGMLARRRKLE